jgi:hypothetical protein
MSDPTYELTVVVPSRGRPDALRDLVGAFQMTTTAGTRLVVAVDEDDPYLVGYHRVQEATRACQIGTGPVYLEPVPYFDLVVGPPSRIGPILNDVVPRYAVDSFAMGFMGDDHRPRTQGWDRAYVDALYELGTGVVWGDDLIMGPQIPTQVAMTSNIVLATGHFVPEGMKHLWLDNAWKAIGEATSFRYLPHVIVEHMHPIAGKGEWDASYRANNTDEVFEHDRLRFLEWQAHELPEWIQKIREYNGG